MFWSDVVLGFQVMWIITKDLVIPILVVSGLIWLIANLIAKYWLEIKYWLRVASRTVSWVFIKLAWLIIRLIDGKKTADKWFQVKKMNIPNEMIEHINFIRVVAIAGIKGMSDEELANELGTLPNTIKLFRSFRSDILVAPWLANNLHQFLQKNSHLLIGVSDGLGNQIRQSNYPSNLTQGGAYAK